ncbi:molybdenum cofactor guanylyltransferase [Clavibacter sp. Sh2036]|uniref:molybdenum cofactor guanylyltransferase n=1 Tax=Clavibacter sp. Sh2036 TaxID=3397677 RepID=UPI0039DFA0CC
MSAGATDVRAVPARQDRPAHPDRPACPARGEPGATGARRAADTATVILAGGRARRLGGIDKTALVRGDDGASLLAEAVRAAAGCAGVVVVVGAGNRPGGVTDAQRRAAGSARLVDEDPAHGGPASALAAGVRALAHAAPTAWILVLAADLARAPEAVAALLPLRHAATHADGRDAILARDPGGRAQPLLALYRAAPLRAALDAVDAHGGLHGAPLRHVVAALDADRVAYADLPARLCADVDTPADADAHGLRLPDDRITDAR